MVKKPDDLNGITRRTFLAGNLAAMAQVRLDLGRQASPFTREAAEPIAASRRDFWNDWPDNISTHMNRAAAMRAALLKQVASQQQALDRSATVREQLWRILGGRPQQTPLNPRVVGTLDRGEYRIEKLIYESMPGVHVTANLYLPARAKPPYPGILVPLGHSPNGKAYRNYQYSYQSLARKGYAVLAYDPFGQGERRQYLLPGTNTPRYPVTVEHNQAGRPAILFGSSFARYRVWDGIRSLDYLLSRPDIDAQRIGCTGQSGGGTMVMYLAALEPRIHVAVATDGNFENLASPHYDPPGAIADAEQNIPASLPLGLDRNDLLAAFAPKPLLICYSVHDEGQTYSPVYEEASQQSYQELSRTYKIFGAPGKVQIFAGHLPHSLDFFSRRAIYGWFNRWLGNIDAGVEEADFDPSPDEALNCTDTGQVLTSLGGRSIVALNRERAGELLPASPFSAPNPAAARHQIQTRLTTLLNIPPHRGALNHRILSSGQGKELLIEEIQYESEPGMRIVGWFVRTKTEPKARPTILYITDGLADEVVAEPNPFEETLHAGYAIYAIHLRGMGLSLPRPPRGGPHFYKGMTLEERFAWANLVLGNPVIGQRVWDILRAVDYLPSRPDVDASQIRILGKGSSGLAALMATALDDRVHSALIRQAPCCYSSIVESEEYSLALDWFVPGILEHFDVPDIAASISPRPVWIVDAVDAQGSVLPESTVRARYTQRIPADSATFTSLRIHSTATDNNLYAEWLKHSGSTQ
jgi:cephalosporin-C deacetylase-like acetyl esterase